MNNNRRVVKPKTVAESLLYSTVRICGDSGTGTGFFFHIQLENNQQVQLILTNKHVVNGNKKLSFYFHEAVNINQKLEPTNQSFSITVDDCKNIWIPHPNEAVDLGALFFVPIRNHSKEKLGKEIYNISFDNTLIKNDDELEIESDVADEILMIGYPIGLWDDCNNFPIIRKGITATYPALDFQDKSIGVIDIACFPGSSGSPIVVYKNGAYHDKANNSTKIGGKIILLGLLFAGPYHTSEGTVKIKEIPTNNIALAENRQFVHLGYYVKAKEILTLSELIKEKISKNQS